MDAIEIVELKKYYGRNRGVENVSLSVGAGEIYGFVGPNGAGKSTTIRALMGLIKYEHGECRILGQDVRNNDELRKHVGYMPGEANFYANMTVKEVLEYAAALKGAGMDRIKPMAERLYLDLTKKISELSLGNRKKVGIVNAFMHSPKVLILDEPTSGLDPIIQHQFFSMIKEAAAGGAGVLLSSHILSEVQSLCAKVSVIRDGVIVKAGGIESLGDMSLKEVRLGLGDESLYSTFQIEGMSNIRLDGGRLCFDFGGDINVLLAALTKYTVTDLAVNSADLERVIMHFYQKAD